MSLPHTLIFKLRQHTPLIHFQPNQDGATLRATEVKPKLDRYLLDMVFQRDFEKAKTYFIGYTKQTEETLKAKYEKGYNAFDYKLSFNTVKGISFKKSVVGAEESLMLFDGLSGMIKAFNADLNREIRKHITDFFIVTNFGKRVSKGYGSFTISEIDDINVSLPAEQQVHSLFLRTHQLIDQLDIGENLDENLYNLNSSEFFSIKFDRNVNRDTIKKYNAKRKFSYSIPENIIGDEPINELWRNDEILKKVKGEFLSLAERKKLALKSEFSVFASLIDEAFQLRKNYFLNDVLPYTSYIEILDKIELSNRILKSGVNPGNPKKYIKSKLFLHFIDRNEVWEKRLIKKLINNLTNSERQGLSLKADRPPSVNELEGDNSWDDSFSDSQYFFIRAILGLPEQYEFGTTDSNRKFVVTFHNDDIDRFQSPVVYKLIEWQLYVFIKNDFDVIMNKPFSIFFTVREKTRNGWQQIGDKIQLRNSETRPGRELFRTPNLTSQRKGDFITFLKDYFSQFDYAK